MRISPDKVDNLCVEVVITSFKKEGRFYEYLYDSYGPGLKELLEKIIELREDGKDETKTISELKDVLMQDPRFLNPTVFIRVGKRPK